MTSPPNPISPEEGKKVVERLSEFADMVALQPPILLLSGGVAHAQSVMVNGRTISAADIRHVLALLSAKDARIVELTAALEPFARHTEALEGCGDAVEVWLYCTEHDMWLAGDAPTASDFRRALAASKEVET